MKTFTFTLEETWSVEYKCTAETRDEAYDIAQNHQNTLRIDLLEADYVSGGVRLTNEVEL